MKRIILILVALFTIAGLFDFIVSKNRAEKEHIYKIVTDTDGNGIEKSYKIRGKYFRFEVNCNTMNFSDYRLITDFSDTIYPKGIMIKRNNISQPYFLFDDLKENHYKLILTHNDTTSYLSSEISILDTTTLSYDKLILYFDNLKNKMTMNNFNSTLPLIITNTSFKDCVIRSYSFYYKGENLFVDYFSYEHHPNNKHTNTLSSYKVKKEILEKIKNMELRLKVGNDIGNTNNLGFTASFFHNNSIKMYYDVIPESLFINLHKEMNAHRID